jgi:urease accessory protein
MKVIIGVDLMGDSTSQNDELNDAENVQTGGIFIEELPVEQSALGPIEIVSLTWEQRSRARRKCVTSSNTTITIALPRGTVLTDGMLIFNTTERTIEVRAAKEELLLLKPSSRSELCSIAHHLGNWHRNLQMNEDDTLLVEPDSPLLKWLDHQHVEYERVEREYHPGMRGSAHA